MKKSQKLLALETCTNICSVALWDGERLYERRVDSPRSHSKKILPLCEEVLTEAGLTIPELDAIACARGPGSFTGLRIGVGVAKGLAFGQDLPIYGVSSLQVLAYQVLQQVEESRVMALLDARMGELYCAEYQRVGGFAQPLSEECLTDAQRLDVDNWLVAGTGAHEYAEVLTAKGARLSPIVFPMAGDIIALVQNGHIEPVSAADFAPVYLRDKVTD